MNLRRTLTCITVLGIGLGGCAEGDGRPPLELGPKDGGELPSVDLERVVVGDLAPDFSLASFAGPVVTLSDFRGKKNVVLVFYRGHW